MSAQVSAVSAVVNWGNSPKAFVFRNYNHTPGSLSRYAGGSGCQMWQAVRASSAAPGYFQEFPLQSDIHQVGNYSHVYFVAESGVSISSINEIKLINEAGAFYTNPLHVKALKCNVTSVKGQQIILKTSLKPNHLRNSMFLAEYILIVRVVFLCATVLLINLKNVSQFNWTNHLCSCRSWAISVSL